MPGIRQARCEAPDSALDNPIGPGKNWLQLPSAVCGAEIVSSPATTKGGTKS